MTVYVDEIFNYPGKGRWCHMIADDLKELHRMADLIGLRREWFQNTARHPHYDLRQSKRMLALKYGAIEITREELLRKVTRATTPISDDAGDKLPAPASSPGMTMRSTTAERAMLAGKHRQIER